MPFDGWYLKTYWVATDDPVLGKVERQHQCRRCSRLRRPAFRHRLTYQDERLRNLWADSIGKD
jgi:hypothetical protein